VASNHFKYLSVVGKSVPPDYQPDYHPGAKRICSYSVLRTSAKVAFVILTADESVLENRRP
jgi:hypothetical protein